MFRRSVLALAALFALWAASAQATPVAIDFNVISAIGGPVTGSGTAFTDNSFLAPGSFTTSPSSLAGMTMSLSGIPSLPASTSFTAANLNAAPPSWVLNMDFSGTIADLNFFMRSVPANADGYSIEGFNTFNFVLCSGAAVVTSCAGGAPAELDRLVISVTGVRPVPEPGTFSPLALGLLAIAARRRT